jgi:5'-nucleotidase
METTRPSAVYQMDAIRDGSTITLSDHIWQRMDGGSVPDPEGTDRRAVVEGRVSVSPLTAPHTTEHHDTLDGVCAAYGEGK